MSGALPEGRLLSWYGDDFTGSAAVLEALAFAGLPSVLFLDVPTPGQLARFPDARAIGIAGTARSRPPAWMDAHLPAAFVAMAGLGAPVAHYKVCSTFDSAPQVGSIGHAVELALPILGGAWHPLLVAAPPLKRYQAFGNLFATVGAETHRLDRHPVMRRHPITPMDEADVRRHLGRQTARRIGLVDLLALRGPDGGAAALAAARAAGDEIVALDTIDEADLVAAGRLIWEHRGARLLAVGSQGVEYALIAWWRAIGALSPPRGHAGAGAVEAIAVVSGSVAPTTAEQIAWGEANGFAAIAFDAASVLDADALPAAVARAIEAAAAAIVAGRSALVCSARGPDDPAVAAFRAAIDASGLGADEANARLGAALGEVLAGVLGRTGVRRAVIAGGDTSGHAGSRLGVFALTALAPTIPGASLFRAHTERPELEGLELALKGGQMGTPDYFGWIRDGGGDRDADGRGDRVSV